MRACLLSSRAGTAQGNPASLWSRGSAPSVAGELMQRTVFQAMAEQSLRACGATESRVGIGEGFDSQFAYAATFEVFPDVALGDLSGATVETPDAEVTEADIDTMIDRLREQSEGLRGGGGTCGGGR